MEISEKGITFIVKFEGLRLKAYRDVKGVPTIGIGHTYKVRMGTECTPAQAYAWMRLDLVPIERYLTKMLPRAKQYQFDALCSFAFNCGLGNLQQSTLLQKCLHGSPAAEITAQFVRWNKSGGKVVDGLTRRRKAEARLYTEGVY